MSTGSDFDTILSQFEPISLEEVDRASLMRRKDNKYIFSFQHLPDLLNMVRVDYRVLEIEGSRTQQYRTLYFDTDGREMYHKHHRGLANRHKVRIRKYGAGDLHFLEVKKKNAKGVTSKKRVQTNGMDQETVMKEEAFLASCSPYAGSAIEPTMENDFHRITLVNQSQTERVTLDFGLQFTSKESGEQMDLPGVAVAEIKYENHLSGSSIHAAMRTFRIRPRRFSKYAIGMAMLHPLLKQNRFRVKVRKVHQINESFNT
jgi:hypothetical protein